MIGIRTETFAPECWFYVVEHAIWSREWLKDLAKGLMMHTAGSWILRFDIRQSDNAIQVQTKLTLK